jgi:hypothetical protein
MKKLYFLAALFLSVHAMAQEPAGFRESNTSFNSRVDRIQVANLTDEELWGMADESDKNGTLPIYGKIIESPMNALTDGVWTYFPNGDKMWQLRVYSPGALSMDHMTIQKIQLQGNIAHLRFLVMIWFWNITNLLR